VTPDQFIAKWRDSTRTERSASQEHFLDLCELLELPKPGEVDRKGTAFTFEKSANRLDRNKGSADVWKKDCFVWEYKGNRGSLKEAHAQAKMYASDLGNPPLLIVSDMKVIQVHTNFTGHVTETTHFELADLNDPTVRRKLKQAFTDPQEWLPTITREKVTEKAAIRFGRIAQMLQKRGLDPQKVAHFLNRIVFCLFVEDIDMLPRRVFAEILEAGARRPDDFTAMLRDLFRAMRKKDGRFGADAIPWFNGGLFDDDEVLALGFFEIKELLDASRLDWAVIEPAIFGTLFERGLSPEKREKMAGLFDAPVEPAPQKGLFDRHAPDRGVGIHYTDPATIMKIVEPVVLAPLRREWEQVKAEIAKHRAVKTKARTAAAKTKAENAARDAYQKFRHRLGQFRVLDPACGSGNFLYLALLHLKDFDLAVIKEAEALGLPLDGQRVMPEAVMGIEINPYAAEIARVTIWIGELQWQMTKGLEVKRRPILATLHNIECRDALLREDGTEAEWPAADAVIGNPPFLGGKLLRTNLGDAYVERLFGTFQRRVPAEADLVCYWFGKAWENAEEGKTTRVGLVATNSIRGGANRRVLEPIARKGVIFSAWDDEAWVIEGVAVRVSLICFSANAIGDPVSLDGRTIERINADLTSSESDLTAAQRLSENRNIAFMGDTKGGAFDVSGDLARSWLALPANPNGRPNADVLRPWVNGMDTTRRPSDKWIVGFGWKMSEGDAAFYQAPFEHVLRSVKPERDKNRREAYRLNWWRHVEPRQGMWREIGKLKRFIVTPEVSKHRIFVWLMHPIVPDHKLQVFARDDYAAFGILHSRFHARWALSVGSWHGVGNDPRYTIGTCFETFPFPEGLTPNIPASAYATDPRARHIAAAAKALDEKRNAWLNPPDLVRHEPEVVSGFPDRLLPVSDKAAAILKKRTLTNLYNERPAWLDNLHRELDAAVAAAYGWPVDLADDEVLARLFALNQERASHQRDGGKKATRPKPRA
jgi:hypothetical protein